jgi:23S rRNA (cytidine1920-2'-O)/16S rRNA (cytidine1409-2'-O)-methyltransferase
VDDSQARRSGIISDSAYVPLLKDLVRYLNKAPGSAVANVCSSPVTGNNGTLEFFLHIVFAKFFPAPHLDLKIEESVAQALRLLPFRKADRSLYERRLRKDLG